MVVQKWVRRAQMDFDSAAKLVETRFEPPIEVVCYLCQQSAEKILKAYTIAKTNARSTSHKLEDLLDACVPHSAEFNTLRSCCLSLSPYATLARYPSIIEPTEQHMKMALKDASKILEVTKSELGL
jgi:HEPN domain-containing protein